MSVTPLFTCSPIMLSHQPLQMSFAPLKGLLRGKRAVVHSVQNISHDKTLPDNRAVIY